MKNYNSYNYKKFNKIFYNYIINSLINGVIQKVFLILVITACSQEVKKVDKTKHLEFSITLLDKNYEENWVKIKGVIKNSSQDTVVAFSPVSGFNFFYDLITMDNDSLNDGIRSSPVIKSKTSYLTLIPNEHYEFVFKEEFKFPIDVDSIGPNGELYGEEEPFRIRSDEYYRLVYYYFTDNSYLLRPYGPYEMDRLVRVVNEKYVDTTKIINEHYQSNILKF